MLQIPRAHVEDTGRYTCVAVNEAGEDSIQYDVRVLCKFRLIISHLAELDESGTLLYCVFASVPPTIRGTDVDVAGEVTVLVNKTTQLDCHVDGNPAPKITWFKDNQPLISDRLHRVLSNGRALQVASRKHRLAYKVIKK